MKIGYVVLVCAAAVCSAATKPERIRQAPLLEVSDVTPANVAVQVEDGGSTHYVTFRLRLEGASAVRLHLTELRLAQGDRLYVHSGDGARTYGPVEGSGPTNSGDFMSEPIAGSDVVVEWQRGDQGGGDLPFTVHSLQAAELGVEPAAEVTTPVEQPEREVRTSLYRGSAVTHEVIDGMAVLEGDIILGRADEMIPAEASTRKGARSSVGITGTRYRWPNGIMPYVIDPAIVDPGRVLFAVAHWNTRLMGTLKMVPRTTESIYVRFARNTANSDCTSYVGMQGIAAQPIGVSDSCSAGTLIHEIGHAWGLWHEHTREDRDKYVTINWANIRAGQSHNFSMQVVNGDDLGTYDHGSIMHYAATSYSVNGQPTITTIPPGISIGQRSGLSAGDVAGIKQLYPTSPVPTGSYVSVTITGNPSWANVIVDGLQYATPSTFWWKVGSTHTISAPEFNMTGRRSTFVKWSNGGAQTQTFTVPAAATTLTATLQWWFRLTMATTGIGTATVSPAAADHHYARLAKLSLNATPAVGYCFAGWTGLVALTPASTELAIANAYALTAKFVSGTVAVSSQHISAPAAGITTSVNVTAPASCYWAAKVEQPASWLTLSSTTTVMGPGSLIVTVAPNTTGAERSEKVTVGGNTIVVTQPAL